MTTTTPMNAIHQCNILYVDPWRALCEVATGKPCLSELEEFLLVQPSPAQFVAVAPPRSSTLPNVSSSLQQITAGLSPVRQLLNQNHTTSQRHHRRRRAQELEQQQQQPGTDTSWDDLLAEQEVCLYGHSALTHTHITSSDLSHCF